MTTGDKPLRERLLGDRSLPFDKFVEGVQELDDSECESLQASARERRRFPWGWVAAAGIVVAIVILAGVVLLPVPRSWLLESMIKSVCERVAPSPAASPEPTEEEITPTTVTPTPKPTLMPSPTPSQVSTETISFSVCARYAGTDSGSGPVSSSGVSLKLNGQDLKLEGGGCANVGNLSLRPGDEVRARIVLPASWRVADVGDGWRAVPGTDRVVTWAYRDGEEPKANVFYVVAPRVFSGSVALASNASPIPHAQMVLLGHQEEPGWQLLDAANSGRDGRFSLTHSPAYTQPWRYRVRLVGLPDGYVSTGVITPSAPQGWEAKAVTGYGVVLQSSKAITGAQYSEIQSLNFETELSYVHLDVTQANCEGIEEVEERPGTDEQGATFSYWVITPTTAITEVTCAWQVALPARKYEVQVWTPPEAEGNAQTGDAFVARLDADAGEGHTFIQTTEDREKWQGFEKEGPLTSTLDEAKAVTLRLSFESDNGDGVLYLGPVRLKPIKE